MRSSLENGPVLSITAEAALAAMEQAVAERGADYVYRMNWRSDDPTCVYVKDGKPSCLVGQALHNLGVDLETLSDLDTDHSGSGEEGTAIRQQREWLADQDVVMSDAALDVFARAQAKQDSGSPWGEALAAGREAVGMAG